jgi:hypothetical protein
MYYLPGRKQNFVRSVPGQPFQIKIALADVGDVEVLVFDGAAPYADVKQLLDTDIPGVIFTGEGRVVVLERMVGLVGSPAPLIFGSGTGIIGVKLFNERRDPLSTSFAFERGWELGEKLIHYGPEIPM